MYNKNVKGLTLVEVLVSVVITILVMLYGMTLFISAWRLEVDSEEYNKVLEYVSNTIEYYKNYANPKDINSGKAKTITYNTNPAIEDITLPSGKILRQKVKIYNEDANTLAIPMVVIATWPAVNAKHNQKIETIVVNTHLGINETNY
jgi:hypothetical protein